MKFFVLAVLVVLGVVSLDIKKSNEHDQPPKIVNQWCSMMTTRGCAVRHIVVKNPRLTMVDIQLDNCGAPVDPPYFYVPAGTQLEMILNFEPPSTAPCAMAAWYVVQ